MRIVIADAFAADQGAEHAWDELHALAEVVRYDRCDADDLASKCAGAQIIITNKTPFGPSAFAALPELRHIAISATGYNIIDTKAAQERGIAVSNVPGYSTAAVTQATFSLLLACTNAAEQHSQQVHAGQWSKSPDFCFLAQPIVELHGKTMAIIGSGSIGQAVAAIATAFGMQVLFAHIPGRPAKPGHIPLDEALARADVISLHCPQSELTTKLLNKDSLSLCKDAAILLNTARGGLIDEAALASWLSDHPQARAGLDVLTSEPPAPDHPLTTHPQTIITPHNAWAGTDTRAALRREVCHNIAAWINGEQRNRIV